MMMDNVIPAKISKWPGGAPSYPIFVQQDNAKPHSTNGDQIIESHCIKQGPTVLTWISWISDFSLQFRHCSIKQLERHIRTVSSGEYSILFHGTREIGQRLFVSAASNDRSVGGALRQHVQNW
jgi:hypothetical protein